MTTAREIMTQEVATICGSATVAQAAKLMRLKNLHSLVVERRHDQDAYGLLTDQAIANQVIAYGKDPKTVRVYELMTKPCVVVNPDLLVEYVARLFTQTGVDRAPVIQGELLGIISITDLIAKSDFIDNPRVPLLQKALQAAIANARAVAAANPDDEQAIHLAWKEANCIEAELAFCTGDAHEKTAYEQFGPSQAAKPAAVAV
jgi:CBS domain-containing protein